MFPIVSTVLAIFLMLAGLDIETDTAEPALLPGLGAIVLLILLGETVAFLGRRKTSPIAPSLVRFIFSFFDLYPIAGFSATLFLFHWTGLSDLLGMADWVLADKLLLLVYYLSLSNLSRYYRNRFARALRFLSRHDSRMAQILSFKGELTLLIPFVFFMLLNDLAGLNRKVSDYLTLIPLLFWTGISLLLLLIALVLPGFIRILWSMKPLPNDSSLRKTLAAFMKAQGFRARDILVLPSGGRLINAAILGFFSWNRYIIFTDAMLARFTAPELKAVFAHELGHGRKKHIPLYLLFST
ncbi:MAG: M48 family metalloprotease, partial [Planctomycetes bacterium]|nr:M48 family metalloprotease [Planctomycetota bacterium]